MSYRVKIESFEGPFQLLLALVSEQKVDIGAVSITEVADQYLTFVESLRDLDMDVASDFLVVASTLLAIKASALLPSEDAYADDEEFDDLAPHEARDILVARLIAYKKFKNAAAALSARLENESRMHARQAGLEPEFLSLMPDFLEGVSLHSLAVICAGLVLRREVFLLEAEHITSKPVPVEERVASIITRLEKKRHMSFEEMLNGNLEPTMVVASFLAVLELYHRGMIDLEQSEQCGSIEIRYREKEDWAPAARTLEEGTDTVTAYLESIM